MTATTPAGVNVTLPEFLLARIAEDEKAGNDLAAALVREESIRRTNWRALGLEDRVLAENPVWEMNRLERCQDPYEMVIVMSAARCLAECAAKRRIAEKAIHTAKGWNNDRSSGRAGWALSAVLRLLALPYADHPDYQQEWKP